MNCDMGAGFGVGQGVVMILEVVAACCGDSLELMVWQPMAEMTPRGGAGVVERIVRIVHLVDLEDLFQTSFVEGTVVRHERQAFYHWLNLLPYIGKYRRIIRIFFTQAVDLLAKPLIVFRLRMDKAIE